MDKITGRYFIYNNNNKVLVFSHNPIKYSERDDRTKPLFEMDLNDENGCRLDPSLYVLEFNDYSMLMVIGGYKKKKD